MQSRKHLHKDEDTIYCDAPKAIVWNAVDNVSNSTCDLCIKGFIDHSLTKMNSKEKRKDGNSMDKTQHSGEQ